MSKFSNMKLRYKIAVVAALGAGALTAGGAAFAYWTSSGSGTGFATTGTAVSSLKITDTTLITDMAPGVAAEPISGTIQNTSSTQSQYVNAVTVSIASVTESRASASAYPGYTCSAADYTLSSPTMSVGKDLTVGSSPVAFSGATIGFNDLAVDQDACQGATVNLSYTSN